MNDQNPVTEILFRIAVIAALLAATVLFLH